MSRLLEDDNPILVCQVDCFLYRQPSQNLLIDVDNLVVPKNLSRTEHCGLDLGRCRFKLEAPVLHRALLGQAVKHLADAFHAVPRRQLGLHQGFSHAGALADMVGYTIQDCELRRKVKKIIGHLHHKKWLAKVCDTQVVHLLKVVSDAHLNSVVGELKITDTLFKVNVMYDVGALGAPVSNDTLSAELELYCLLVLVITVSISLYLTYLF